MSIIKEFQEVETFLPCFSGFYNAIWSPIIPANNQLEKINNERTIEGLPWITYDEFEFDYVEYELNIVRGITDYLINKHLTEFVTQIAVQEIISPEYYNYANDSVNVLITINTLAVKNFIETHLEYIAASIKADYSKDYKVWKAETYDWMNWSSNTTYLGAILEFIVWYSENQISLEQNMYIEINQEQ